MAKTVRIDLPGSFRWPFWTRLSDFSPRCSGRKFECHRYLYNRESLGGIGETANLRILRNCHGAEYFEQLRSCDIVVVPLCVEDISQDKW